jgi:hypothetical protein
MTIHKAHSYIDVNKAPDMVTVRDTNVWMRRDAQGKVVDSGGTWTPTAILGKGYPVAVVSVDRQRIGYSMVTGWGSDARGKNALGLVRSTDLANAPWGWKSNRSLRVSGEDSMNPADQDLLSKLQTLLAKLAKGDPEARDAASKLKEASKRGDKAAARAWGTLAALYWGKLAKRKAWSRVEDFYAKLTADDPKALDRLKKLQAVAKSNSPKSDDAKKAFAMLKAVHNHRKESVWYPGAPKTGYYPMPQRHRPGIVTGGPFDIPGLPAGLPGNLGIPGLGGGGIPGLPPGGIPGLPPGLGGPQPQSPLGNLLGQLPGNLGQFIPPGGIPGLPPGLGGPQPNPLGGLLGQLPGGLGGLIPPGLLGGQPVPPGLLQSPEGQALRNFLPITPESMQGLLGMITQARQSPSAQSLVQAPPRSSAIPFQGGPGSLTTMAFTTVPKPTGGFMSRQPAPGAMALGRVKAPVRALGTVPGAHLSAAEATVIRSDEARLSALVASAVARNSPAAPGLQRQLAALRAANAAKGATPPISFEF